MSDLSSKVTELQHKINKLIELHRKATAESRSLHAEKKDHEKIIMEQKKKIAELVENNKIIKLAKSLSGENVSSLDIKLKINELVREIDKCIAYFNR